MSSHHDPLSSISSKKKPVYDVKSFLSCTAITSRLLPGEQPVLHPIPETLIASPLAPNLAPATLLDIRELLTGESISGAGVRGSGCRVRGGNAIWKGAGRERGRDRGREKGDEVWRAWKRAWDLWNGYFVEGRVNEGWVRGEYERIKGELEVERERVRSGQGGAGGVEMDRAGDDEGQGGVNMPSSNPVWRGTPPVPTLKDAEEVVKEDGSTGGFMPMRLLPEYCAPETDEAGDYPEGWEDVLANTVWRPRRVGEMEGEVSVGIDGEWGEKSGFEFDGGVDCGRSPYPCLRYVVEYVRRDGCFLKKKVWDGVTGTIFNMPTSPSSPSSPTISDNQRRISALYGDFHRYKAPQHRNPEYFPLDIRRVDIIDPETGKKHPVTPLLEGGEELVRWPWNNPEGSFVQLDASDPWYVTDEQHERQLVPPRKYPPGKPPCPGGDTLLPTDDTIWREEIENDANFRSQYFVTNLHGGTLIVNGLEIKLGQVAGPLPEFAIIETPGNQISFWFGPQGRDWRGAPDGAPLCTSQWKTLRRSPGWEYVGLTAGQVWDMRIRDRLRREYKGEEDDDDARWDEWKAAVVKQKPIPEKISPLDMVIWDGHPGPSPAHAKQTPEAAQPEFSTELEELQWLVTKAYPLKDVTPTLERENIIVPSPSSLWPGPNTPERPDIVHQQCAQRIWDKRREEILQQQRDMNAMLAQQRATQALGKKQKIDAENKKRKAASSGGPAGKKARRDGVAPHRANAEAEYEDGQDKLQEDWEREREIWENDSTELEKVAEDAAIAAKTREALKAQAPKLSLLSDRQREKEEKEIKDQVKSQHAVQRKKEQELRKARMLEANKERAEKDLQLLSEYPPPVSEEDRPQMAVETRKMAKKKDEERRKQSELEKNHQEDEKLRKEAEKKRQDAAAALKQTAEPAKDNATALAKRVAEALAAENEQKRLQFIADREAARKVELEQREKEAAAEAARDERARRAYLFQDKYGVLPRTDSRLDSSGKPEFGQGFEPPRKPRFTILSPADLERMTEGEWIDYAKLLSMQTAQPGNSATIEKPVDLSNMYYDQQIAHATKQSLGINGFRGLEEENTRKVLIENVKRLLLEQSARIRLDLKAKVEGVSAEQYAISHNFKSAADYIFADINPFGTDNLPQVEDNDLPPNVLQMSRYWIQHYAQTGLQIRANREGKSMDALAQEKGYPTFKEYLRALSDSIRIDDIPAIPKNQTPQDKEKWEALCQRIIDAGEWEARVRYLPGPRTLRPLADKRQKRFIVL